MRLIYFVFLSMVSLLTMPIDALSFSRSDISFSSEEVAHGDVILIAVKSNEEEPPIVTWMEKEISLVFNPAITSWQGFLAVDLDYNPGVYRAAISMPSSNVEENFEIRVVEKDYGVRKLTLPKEKVELDAQTLKRVKKEAAVVSALWNADITLPKWDGGFLVPVDGDIIGTFGKRSIINNLKRSPHTGIDLRGSTGTPVKATNNGEVILIADHFFTGSSLYLDHGGGIISMYFHLDKILVKNGENVEKGQVIGLVGATGRVTGPHLHWGVRVNGARVNPLTLIDLSKGLEE